MPKMMAPHGAAWRGRALDIAPDGTVDVPDDAVAELAAHGFRVIENATPEADEARVASLSRKQLIALIREHGGGNAVTLSNDALRAAARALLAQTGKGG
jgi:hypothetical protein